MQRSTDRMYTTHVGSLARPAALLDLMRAAAAGEPVDETERAEAERQAVADVVAPGSVRSGWTSFPMASRPRPGSSPTSARG